MRVSVERAIEIARQHATAKRFTDAEQILRQITIASPGRVDALNDLGMVLGQQGKYDEAEQWLRRAVELDKRYVPAWHNLAVAAEHRGRLEEAVTYVRQAVTNVPDYWENYFRLGQSLKRV